MPETVQDNETVVEFFSFYCPPCYAFSQGYGIDGAIRESLPAGGKMVKYHMDFLGALGSELTRAWSVAMLSGLEEKVEPLLFDGHDGFPDTEETGGYPRCVREGRDARRRV